MDSFILRAMIASSSMDEDDTDTVGSHGSDFFDPGYREYVFLREYDRCERLVEGEDFRY